jgi:hypothetical protein
MKHTYSKSTLVFLCLLFICSITISAQGIEITSGGSIVCTGNASININNGDLINNGSFTKGTETVTISGTTAKTISGSSNTSINSLTISNTGGVTSQQSLLTVGTLTINSGGKMDVAAQKGVTVSGNISNSGTLTLKSGASGNATILTSGTLSGSGVYNAEQYFTGAGGATPNGVYWYIGSPVSNATSLAVNALGDNKLWSWNEASTDYTEISNNASSLNPMQGYVLRTGATETNTFTGGAFNSGDISNTSLLRTGTANTLRGFHLIGNPYPSYLNWDDATRTNLSTSLWYRTHNGTTMVYDTYNASGGVGTNNNGGGEVTEFIPPFQSFWVRVNADGNTGQLAFTNAMRSHQTGHLRTATAANPNKLILAISDGANRDESLILFNANASDSFDDYDSEKMFATGIAQCYSSNENGDMAINTFAPLTLDKVIPIKIKIVTNGNYTFEANDLAAFESNKTITLEDKLTSTITDLRATPVYNFQANAGVDETRFVVSFRSATDVKEKDQTNISIYAHGKTIYLQNLKAGSKVEIFDVLGTLVYSKLVTVDNITMDLNNAPGIYVVKVSSDIDINTRKVIIE